MRAHIYFILCSICGVLGKAWSVPGVAFSLNPDYGTAVIYYANGSFVEIGPFEGTQEYKTFLRSSKPSYTVPELAACRFVPPSLQGIFNICTPSAAVASAETLLRSLQSSVTSHLGTSFCYAELVLHNPSQEDGYQRDILQEALKRIGRRQAVRGVPVLPASSLAVHANLRFPTARTLMPQAALSIEYSRWGMNVALFCVDRLVLEEQRHEIVIFPVESQTAGAQDGSRDNGARLEEAGEALRRISKPPLGSCSVIGDMPDKIQVLILHGDSVRDSGFMDLLKGLFGRKLVAEAYDFDPLFASAVGGAVASHDNMDQAYFNEPAAFGCRWPSKLYREQNQEL
ncbi:hypothetical protein CORC01_13920 [Colletotrichum orchidophilum]|uniref:Uncharacterized protein n=1 Tax=Colletotrichum orchidophilum TaxID=1209926 RepID=A0A1G4ANL7_9PEZI|nr:uncharacterized protein CORC01_13920 [Colletotrichum orchidophilum]OHE90780.1 hypothetical protein CORC01_13920 [Colletotrichum orchidophilum]